jgi:hypothetical protein
MSLPALDPAVTIHDPMVTSAQQGIGPCKYFPGAAVDQTEAPSRVTSGPVAARIASLLPHLVLLLNDCHPRPVSACARRVTETRIGLSGRPSSRRQEVLGKRPIPSRGSTPRRSLIRSPNRAPLGPEQAFLALSDACESHLWVMPGPVSPGFAGPVTRPSRPARRGRPRVCTHKGTSHARRPCPDPHPRRLVLCHTLILGLASAGAPIE